jgi:hypothetical protein
VSIFWFLFAPHEYKVWPDKGIKGQTITSIKQVTQSHICMLLSNRSIVCRQPQNPGFSTVSTKVTKIPDDVSGLASVSCLFVQ